MKKTILLSLIALGTLSFAIGCASVEADDDDGIAATRSTTVVHSDL